MRNIKKSDLYQESDYKLYKTEAELTKKVKEWLDLQYYLKYDKISDRFTKGKSDLILCVKGKYVAIELKDDEGEPSPHQLKFIVSVKRAGGIAGVCNCLYEVKKLVYAALE